MSHSIEEQVFIAVSTVIDPEVGFNLVEMGLIYNVDVNEQGNCIVTMTLSTPSCPMHGQMQQWVKDAALKVEGINEVEINLVFEPQWNPTMATDEVKAKMGYK